MDRRHLLFFMTRVSVSVGTLVLPNYALAWRKSRFERPGRSRLGDGSTVRFVPACHTSVCRSFEMPLAIIKLIEGVFTDDEKRQMIIKVTDAMVAVEGENIRDKTVVIIEETKSGDWGIGGTPITTGDVTGLRQAG